MKFGLRGTALVFILDCPFRSSDCANSSQLCRSLIKIDSRMKHSQRITMCVRVYLQLTPPNVSSSTKVFGGIRPHVNDVIAGVTALTLKIVVCELVTHPID